jgi:septation ring formation regulator
MDDIKNTYDLSEAEINKFNTINKALEQINEDYKVLFEHGKGRTFAYSKLVEELDGLSARLTRLQDDLDYRLKSITSMKDDEYRAKEQLHMIEQLLLQAKSKLKDYKIPVIPNSYFIELKEAGEAIREIIKELDKKPIVIKILNIRVDTARDLVFKIYNKTNDIVKSVILCEKLIVYGNRYRTTYDNVDVALTEAIELFRKGKYKQSMDLSLKAISEVDETVYERFGIEQG